MHEVAGFTDPEDTDRLHKPPYRLLVYPRDHSVQNSRPSTTHGAYALHVERPDDPYIAACDRRILLDTGLAIDASQVSEWAVNRLCKRRGCVAARATANAPDADVPLPCHDGTGPAHREHANHGPK